MAFPLDHAGSDAEWESRYVGGDTPWDKGAPHPALLDWVRKRPIFGRILVPGCGLGYDVRAIAASSNEVIGLDLAPSAVATAEKFPRVAGEQYFPGDFFAPPESWAGSFDWIFEHTCFCAINPALRIDYVRSAARLLKSGGHFLAIFFLNPGNEGAGPPFGCSIAELDQFFAADFELLEERAALPTFAGRENRELLRLLRKR